MNYYGNNFRFGGVYARNTLRSISCEHNKFYIVNLNEQHESGSHWLAIVNFDRCYYFDSYAAPPPIEIEKFVSDTKEVVVNHFRLQALGSIWCGYYCIYVINKICEGKSFYDILLEFDPNDYESNDRTIATCSLI